MSRPDSFLPISQLVIVNFELKILLYHIPPYLDCCIYTYIWLEEKFGRDEHIFALISL